MYRSSSVTFIGIIVKTFTVLESFVSSDNDFDNTFPLMETMEEFLTDGKEKWTLNQSVLPMVQKS